MENMLEMLIRRSRQTTPQHIVPQDFIWYTPFSTNYAEMTSGIVGVPYQPSAFSIAHDASPFAGYLQARKTQDDSYGIEWPNTATYMDLSGGEISVCFWLRADPTNWSNYSQLLMGTRPSDYSDGWVIYKDGGGDDKDIDFRSNQNDNRSSSAVDDGQWHCWIFTRDDEGNWAWYKDGSLATHGDGDTSSINGTTQNMKVGGGFNWSKGAYFDLAQLRVYDRVLDATERTQIVEEYGTVKNYINITPTELYCYNGQSSSIQIETIPSGCTWSTNDTLPSGFSLASDGTVSYDGTAYQSNMQTACTFTASKQGYDDTSITISLHVELQSVEFYQINNAVAFFDGVPASYQLYTNTDNVTFSAWDNLPSGVTLSSSGLLAYDGTAMSDNSNSEYGVNAVKQYWNGASRYIRIMMAKTLPATPTGAVFDAPLSTDLNDHSATGRTGTAGGDNASSVAITTYDNEPCLYIPAYAGVSYPIGNNVPLGHSARTLSVWFATEYDSWYCLLGYGENNDYKHSTIVDSYGYPSYWGGSADVGYGYAINNTHWHNLTATVRPSGNDDNYCTVTLYLDGVKVNSEDWRHTNTTGTTIDIGCIDGWYGVEYPIYLRGAKIFDSVLSDWEVLSLVHSDSEASDSSSSGSDASDSSSSSLEEIIWAGWQYEFTDGVSDSTVMTAYQDNCTFSTEDDLTSYGLTLASDGTLSYDGTSLGSDTLAEFDVTAHKAGYQSTTAQCQITIKQLEMCPECGTVMQGGICENPSCSLSPNYMPPEEYCPECGNIMNNGVCENPSCSMSPYFTPPEEPPMEEPMEP